MKKTSLWLLLISGWILSPNVQAQEIKTVERNGKKYVQYRIQKGETLYKLAKTYNTTPEDVEDTNPEIKKGFNVGKTILLPALSTPAPTGNDNTIKPKTQTGYTPDQVGSGNAEAEAFELVAEKHTVGKGESLTKIAKDYDITLKSLRELNNLAGDKITPGQELIVGVRRRKRTQAPANNGTVAANNTRPKSGSTLRSANPSEMRMRGAETTEPQTEDVDELITHRVSRGETLSKIATTYGVGVEDILEWNSLPDEQIRPGDVIEMYVKKSKVNTAQDTEVEVNDTGTSETDDINPEDFLLNYRVREADNLYQLRTRFNVSREEMLYWNNRQPNRDGELLMPGQNFKIYQPRIVKHTIANGDKGTALAQRFGVTVRQLEIWNKVQEKHLDEYLENNQGKVLEIYQPTGPRPTAAFKKAWADYKAKQDGTASPNNEQPSRGGTSNNANTVTTPANAAYVIYTTTTDREFLVDIAKKYGITVDELREWNGINEKEIYAPKGVDLRVQKREVKKAQEEQPNRGGASRTRPNTSAPKNGNTQNTSPNTPAARNNNNTTTARPNNTQNNGRVATTPNNNTSTALRSSNRNTNTQPAPSNPTTNNNVNLADFGGNNTPTGNNVNVNLNDFAGTQEVGSHKIVRGYAAVSDYVGSGKANAALHATAPIGTIIVVKNLNNAKQMVVEVVGNIDSESNEPGVEIVLTNEMFRELGAGENTRLPVEISYFNSDQK